MAKTYEGLKADANIIKNEIEAQRNTATRVGTMLVDCIDKMEDVDNTVNTRINNVNNTLSGEIAGVNIRITNVQKESLQTITYLVEELNRQLAEVQGKLVSGENIKTINGESVLGSGNVSTSIDVSALFVVGGKMQVGGIDLLTHHLYVRTANYVSNVSVVVGNKLYILEARRRESMNSYNTVGVKAVVTFADGTGLATCIDVVYG
jgi:hypothetical protein